MSNHDSEEFPKYVTFPTTFSFLHIGVFIMLIFFSLTAPMVRFLRERLEKAGCIVEDNFFKAITCNQEVAGSYVRGEGVPISFLNSITASLFCSR